MKMSWQSLTANKKSCLLKSVWRRTAESRRKFLSVLSALEHCVELGAARSETMGRSWRGTRQGDWDGQSLRHMICQERWRERLAWQRGGGKASPLLSNVLEQPVAF